MRAVLFTVLLRTTGKNAFSLFLCDLFLCSCNKNIDWIWFGTVFGVVFFDLMNAMNLNFVRGHWLLSFLMLFPVEKIQVSSWWFDWFIIFCDYLIEFYFSKLHRIYILPIIYEKSNVEILSSYLLLTKKIL